MIYVYFLIGSFLGGANYFLSEDRQDTYGMQVEFTAITVFWPVILAWTLIQFLLAKNNG